MDTVVAHPTPGQFHEATRSLTSVLAPIEKRTLTWLARRMPGWVNSDHLTGLALFSMLLAGLSYWLARVTPVGLVLVVVFLAVNWFGDSLDGTVARVRGHQRPRYGFYVDHLVDALGAVFLLGGLGLSGYMSPAVACAVLVAYLLLLVETFLATCNAHVQNELLQDWSHRLRILLAIERGAAVPSMADVFGRDPPVRRRRRGRHLRSPHDPDRCRRHQYTGALPGRAPSGRRGRPMTQWARFARFNAVGTAGIAVQLATVWLLADVAHMHYLFATPAAVALAVLHNFAWHWQWTWHDRARPGELLSAFARFAAANGANVDEVKRGRGLPTTEAWVAWFNRACKEESFIASIAATNIGTESQSPMLYSKLLPALREIYRFDEKDIEHFSLHSVADVEGRVADHRAALDLDPVELTRGALEHPRARLAAVALVAAVRAVVDRVEAGAGGAEQLFQPGVDRGDVLLAHQPE